MSKPLTMEDLESKTQDLIQREKALLKKQIDLNEREKNLRQEEKEHDFSIEFKSQSYAAFYATSMETDKSILTIAVAGLGFLIAIIQSDDIPSSVLAKILVGLSCTCYLASIFLLIKIFKLNKIYLISIVNEQAEDCERHSKKLMRLDWIASITFYMAVFQSVVLGIITSNFFS